MCAIFIRKKNNKKVILYKKLITSYINRRTCDVIAGSAFTLLSVRASLFTGITAPATYMRLTTSHAWYIHNKRQYTAVLNTLSMFMLNDSPCGLFRRFPALGLRAPSCSPFALPHRAAASSLGYPSLSVVPVSQPCQSGRGVAGLLVLYLYLMYTF